MLFALRLIALASLAAAAWAQAPADMDQDHTGHHIDPVHDSIVITATPLGPQVDYRNAEVFNETLFSRDDQVFHLLNGGINAGQHEGGGKSLEIRRFGFNLDHGGAGGGLKVLVDNVPQNLSTQGHGQGYLGSLKSMSPELVGDVLFINGPFSAEYGDFSGLGVLHIRQRETLPQQLTLRLQGGSFGNRRIFAAFSPNVNRRDAVFAYEGSHIDGPFRKPLNYRRDNVTGNYTWRPSDESRFGLKWNGGRNDFESSGQIPLDEVSAGRLDRFGFLSPGDGGHVVQGRIGGYYRRDFDDGSFLKTDGFVERSLFDLYSNFTFLLNDPVNGDGIQQHDSRLTEGGNVQYVRPHMLGSGSAQLTVGANYLDSQNDVGLLPTVNRNPIDVFTSAHARVSNGGGYVQEDLALANGKLTLGAGLRWDFFRFGITDFLEPRVQRDSLLRWAPTQGEHRMASFNPYTRQSVRQLWTRHLLTRRPRRHPPTQRTPHRYNRLSRSRYAEPLPRPLHAAIERVPDPAVEPVGLHSRRRLDRVQRPQPLLRFRSENLGSTDQQAQP